jgi:hypothetical protein
MRAIVGSATDVLNDAAENFLGQVEDTCRSRWTQMFDGSPDLPETESTAA